MAGKIENVARFVDLTRQGLAFWQTYVESSTRRHTGFLSSLMFGEPSWEMLTGPAPERAGAAASLAEAVRDARDAAGRSALIEREKLCGLIIAPEDGGLGFGLRDAMDVVAALAANDPAAAVALVSQAAAVPGMIRVHGTEEQARQWLPRIASGEKRVAYALSEPGAGSDARSLRTHVRSTGSELFLNGEKSFVANGEGADLLVVFATGLGDSEEDRARLSALLVPAGKKGVERVPVRLGAAWEGAGIAHVSFRDVRIPAENLLGRAGEGYRVAQPGLDAARIFAAAVALGSARTLESEARRHVADTVQFGKALAEFDMVKERLAAIAVALRFLESASEVTAELGDKGFDVSVESACVRLAASREAATAVAAALDLLGAAGLAADGPAGRAVEILRGLRFIGGSDDVLRIYLALQGGRSSAEFVLNNRKGRKGSAFFDALVKGWWRGFRLAHAAPRLPGLPEGLKEPGRVAAECAGTLAARLHQVFDYYGAEASDHEFELRRLADMAVETYELVAALRCASRNGAAETDAIAARFRGRRTWRRVAELSSEIYLSDDSDVERLVRPPG